MMRKPTTILACALQRQGNFEEAAAHHRQALVLQPTLAEAHTNLGAVLEKQNKLQTAASHHREALRLDPDFAEAHLNLGSVLQKQDQLDAAIGHYRQALQIRPGFAEAHINWGSALQKQDFPAEAIAHYEHALRIMPDSAEAHTNLGGALMDEGKLEEALAHYERAIQINPNFPQARWSRALLWLLQGAYERGWPEYEWRLTQFDHPPRTFSQPRWDGSELDGRTILLHAEQGLGDTLQFIRYVPLVRKCGGKVVVECQPPLVDLVRSVEGIDQVIAHGSPLPAFAVQAPLLSLPGIFHTQLGTIPAAVPYLKVDAELMEHWGQEVSHSDGLHIGIAWQGNPRHPHDRKRSIPLVQFAPLAAVNGVHLVSLQHGPGNDQLSALNGQFGVREIDCRTLLNLAAVMKNLDLVISCDTAVAHLAGALGVPTWLALPVRRIGAGCCNAATISGIPRCGFFAKCAGATGMM